MTPSWIEPFDHEAFEKAVALDRALERKRRREKPCMMTKAHHHQTSVLDEWAESVNANGEPGGNAITRKGIDEHTQTRWKRAEAHLHELCHAVALGMPLLSSDAIGDAIDKNEADDVFVVDHERWALAIEFRVMHVLRWPIKWNPIIHQAFDALAFRDCRELPKSEASFRRTIADEMRGEAVHCLAAEIIGALFK